MMPEDVCSGPQHESKRQWTDDECRRLWPSARGELLAFAFALERGPAKITAHQLRMAVQLADEAFEGKAGVP